MLISDHPSNVVMDANVSTEVPKESKPNLDPVARVVFCADSLSDDNE